MRTIQDWLPKKEHPDPLLVIHANDLAEVLTSPVEDDVKRTVVENHVRVHATTDELSVIASASQEIETFLAHNEDDAAHRAQEALSERLDASPNVQHKTIEAHEALYRLLGDAFAANSLKDYLKRLRAQRVLRRLEYHGERSENVHLRMVDRIESRVRRTAKSAFSLMLTTGSMYGFLQKNPAHTASASARAHLDPSTDQEASASRAAA